MELAIPVAIVELAIPVAIPLAIPLAIPVGVRSTHPVRGSGSNVDVDARLVRGRGPADSHVDRRPDVTAIRALGGSRRARDDVVGPYCSVTIASR